LSDETEVTGVEIRQSVLIATPVFVLKTNCCYHKKEREKEYV
jgi:hypothetical protein